MEEIEVVADIEPEPGSDVEPEPEVEAEEGGTTVEYTAVVVHHIAGYRTNYYPRRPSITARIVNETGELIGGLGGKEDRVLPRSTQRFDIADRGTVSFCDETLVFEVPPTTVCSRLLLFDLTDVVRHGRHNTPKDVRFAWAFYRPVDWDASPTSHHPVRLQLYKPRKSCKVNHLNCDVFHLYSEHPRKKYPGSLWVTVRGVSSVIGRVAQSGRTMVQWEESREEPEERAGAEEEVPAVTWGRLPGQSCKAPNRRRKELHLGRHGAACVAFSPNGLLLALGTVGLVKVVAVRSAEDLATFTSHTGLVYSVDFSRDSKHLVSASADGTALVWSLDPVARVPLAVLPHPSFVYCGRWLGEGERLVTGCRDHVIRVWARSGARYELVDEAGGHAGFVSCLATDGDTVLSGDSVGCVLVRRWEGAAWRLLKTLNPAQVAGNVIDAVHLHGGRRRAVITARSRGSFLVDVATGVVIQSYKGSVTACARSVSCLTPCGSFLWAFCQNSVFTVWEVNTGTVVATYEAAFSATGSAAEPSGSVAYHPLDHMAVLAVLGAGRPALLLDHSATHDDSARLGLTVRSAPEPERDQGHSANTAPPRKAAGPLDGDKLTSLVRKIDKVFSVKRALHSHSAEGLPTS